MKNPRSRAVRSSGMDMPATAVGGRHYEETRVWTLRSAEASGDSVLAAKCRAEIKQLRGRRGHIAKVSDHAVSERGT